MTKKRCCSTCHNEGHNSRTCNFRDPQKNNTTTEATTMEATSEDNHSVLQLNLTLGSGCSTVGLASSQQPQPAESASVSNNNSREVKINKGVRWSTEEHLGFLSGIQILGKGAWKAISKSYVRTRTANQISSHAQKYFKRMKNPLGRKRNPSIFDILRDEKPQHAYIPYIQRLCPISHHPQLQPNNRLHPLPPSLNPGDQMQIDEGESSKDRVAG